MVAIGVSEVIGRGMGVHTAHDGMARATESHWLCAEAKEDITTTKVRLEESFIVKIGERKDFR